MRILIVEDHADLVTMLIRLLGEAGYATLLTGKWHVGEAEGM